MPTLDVRREEPFLSIRFVPSNEIEVKGDRVTRTFVLKCYSKKTIEHFKLRLDFSGELIIVG